MAMGKKLEGLNWILLFLFFLAGIFYRYYYWLQALPLPLDDLYFYQGLAQAFLNQDWAHFWHFHFYPVYPILMAIAHKISGMDFEICARGLNLIFDSLSIAPIYLIGKEVFNRRVGVVAGLFWSLSYPMIRVIGEPEPIYGFFILWALYFVFKKEAKIKDYLLAIGFASFSCLIKSEGTFFVLFISLMLIFGLKSHWQKKILLVIIAGVIYLAFSSPISIQYWRAVGKFNPNPKPRTLFFIHNPIIDYQHNLYALVRDETGYHTLGQRIYVEGDREAFKESLLGFIRTNFRDLALAYLGKLKLVFSYTLKWLLKQIYPPAIIFALFYWLRRKRDFCLRKELWLWLWGLGLISGICVYNPWDRFFYTLFPVLALISARGLEQIIILVDSAYARFFPKSSLRKVLHWSILSIFVIWFIGYNLMRVSYTRPAPNLQAIFIAKQDLAKWLKPQITPQNRIMCLGFPQPFIYFLDLPFWQMVILPRVDEKLLITYAQEKQVDYIFMEMEDLQRNPFLKSWLSGEVKDSSVELIKRIDDEDPEKRYPYALYKLVKP